MIQNIPFGQFQRLRQICDTNNSETPTLTYMHKICASNLKTEIIQIVMCFQPTTVLKTSEKIC